MLIELSSWWIDPSNIASLQPVDENDENYKKGIRTVIYFKKIHGLQLLNSRVSIEAIAAKVNASGTALEESMQTLIKLNQIQSGVLEKQQQTIKEMSDRLQLLQAELNGLRALPPP